MGGKSPVVIMILEDGSSKVLVQKEKAKCKPIHEVSSGPSYYIPSLPSLEISSNEPPPRTGTRILTFNPGDYSTTVCLSTNRKGTRSKGNKEVNVTSSWYNSRGNDDVYTTVTTRGFTDGDHELRVQVGSDEHVWNI